MHTHSSFYTSIQNFITEYKIHLYTIAILSIGIALRCSYFSITPSEIRGHDFNGHMDYVSYVLDHWNIPHPKQNWQAYQPPLYYFISAGWLSIIGWGERQVGWGYVLQWGSLVFSIITLCIGIWICHQLFPKKKDRIGYCLSALCVAVFPSLIFFAPRINNDALVQVFAFLSLGLLLRWLRTTSTTTLFLLGVSLAAGLITKTTIAPLVVVSVCTILLKHQKNIIHGFRTSAVLVLIISTLWGWLPIHTFFTANDYKELVVGNYQTLTNFVDNSPKNLLVFNPIKVVQIPYNNPFRDEERRQYFWEYFYKSALTGEFNFGLKELPFVVLMIVFSFILLPCIALEAFNDAKKMRIETSPLWLGIPILLLAHWWFRVTFPYSSSQDFRYSIILIIPLAYFACRTNENNADLTIIKHLSCIGFIIGATAFLLHIPG